jgi:hypothetical protein
MRAVEWASRQMFVVEVFAMALIDWVSLDASARFLFSCSSSGNTFLAHLP